LTEKNKLKDALKKECETHTELIIKTENKQEQKLLQDRIDETADATTKLKKKMNQE